MSLDMLHAFQREYRAKFSDIKWRTECEAFSRGWVAARADGPAIDMAQAFQRAYGGPLDAPTWKTEAEAFRRGWAAGLRFAEAGGRIFCAGRAGVVRIAGPIAPSEPTHPEPVTTHPETTTENQP